MSADRPDSFMPLFIADYLADTTHLERDEDGAYLLLLMAYWRRGGPLPADDTKLARMAKATASEWRKLKPVMLEFFKESDGMWVNKRADMEIAKATERKEAKSKAGKKGAESRWQGDGNRMAVPLAEPVAGDMTEGMTKNSSSPSPSPSPSPVSKKERKIMSADADEDGEFAQFWKEYPRTKNMSRKDALKSWKSLRQHGKLPALDEILRAVKSYKSFLHSETKRQGKPVPVKHAQGWLSGERWEGHLEEQVAHSSRPDWADAIPQWASFKAGLPPTHWATWFSECKPNGSPSTLIAPSSFVRDQIESRYGKALDAVFNGEFQVKFGP